jgi:hypothetical protein
VSFPPVEDTLPSQAAISRRRTSPVVRRLFIPNCKPLTAVIGQTRSAIKFGRQAKW